MTPPLPSARPARSVSTRGPAWLTVTGVLLVLAAAVVAALVARGMAVMLPMDVLGPDGTPGSGVVGVVDVPGTAQMELEADTDYALYLAVQGEAAEAELSGDIRVEAPDGRARAATSAVGVSVSTARGATSARTVASFETDEAGTYTLTAPALEGGGDGLVLVAPDRPVLPFVAGIFGSVLGVFLAIGLGLTGVPMTVLGIVWWRRRRSAAAARVTVG